MDVAELTSQQRAAILAYRLGRGDCLTVARAAQLTGLSYKGAYTLLLLLAECIPIYADGPRRHQFWKLVENCR